MKVLFVCKHNRFRSKVAESIFNKLAEGKAKAESRGLFLDEIRPYVEDIVIKIMKEKGYSIGGKPKQLEFQEMKQFDVLAVLSNGITKDFFDNFKGRIFIWNVKDTDASNIKEIHRIVDEIEIKVKDLIAKLNV